MAGVTLLTVTSWAAPVFFQDPFDSNPILGPSQAQVAGAWYWDRYRPAAFDSQPFMGDNRLRVFISSADGAALRPSGFGGVFYNTQGRKFDLNNGLYTSIRGSLWVGADWSTQLRRADLWATARNSSNAVSGFPIFGFANISLTTPNLVARIFSQDTNPNLPGLQSGWVDVSSRVPGGITTNRWYQLEIRLKPGVFEYYIDGRHIFSDSATFNSVSFSDMIVQAYNFNDASLGPGGFPPGLDDDYTVYWDNIAAMPAPIAGFPIDLNGSYRAPSSGPVVPNPVSTSQRSQPGIAFAQTVTTPGIGFAFERNGSNLPAENAIGGSFTPFNDGTKVPNTLVLPTANGTTFEADLTLSGTWKPFQFGAGIGNVPPFATGDTFTVGYNNAANAFGVQLVQDLATGQYEARIASILNATGSLAILETNGTPITFPAGTTQVRVRGQVVGGVFSAEVIALDGPGPFNWASLGSTDGTNMDTNAPWSLNAANMAFSAGFLSYEHMNARANAIVSNFSTNAVPNVMYAFADDPYVRSADPAIIYRVAQANLLQAVTGFQSFMSLSGGQTFQSAAYANGPYTTFNPPTITALLDMAGAGPLENQANINFAEVVTTPGGAQTTVGLSFRPNAGTSQNLFSSGAPNFDDILATTVNSNQVIIDNIAPALAAPTLAGSAWVSPNAVQGNLLISTTATDSGSMASGLDGRPSGTITWSDSSVTPVTTYSDVANWFSTVIPITPSTPNGLATLSLTSCDRSGNCTTVTRTFNVSTVNILLTLSERGVFPSAVSRVIELKFGGSGGSTAPISLRRVVTFDTPVDLLDGAGNPGSGGGNDSLQGTTLITYQDLDLADDNTANNSVPPNAQLTLFRAKDPFFSLAKQEPLSGSMGSYTGSVILRMGDLTNNNVVNVADLAVWAANNGLATSPNTTLAQPLVPRQANIDGTGAVGLGDRNLIISSWLFAGDPDGVMAFAPTSGGNGSLPVPQVIRETGLHARIVMSMDANRDGILTREEVLRWRGISR